MARPVLIYIKSFMRLVHPALAAPRHLGVPSLVAPCLFSTHRHHQSTTLSQKGNCLSSTQHKLCWGTLHCSVPRWAVLSSFYKIRLIVLAALSSCSHHQNKTMASFHVFNTFSNGMPLHSPTSKSAVLPSLICKYFLLRVSRVQRLASDLTSQSHFACRGKQDDLPFTEILARERPLVATL